MGTPMARRLLEAGYRVHCSDADPAAVAQLESEGAVPADPHATAQAADVLLLVLPSSDVVEQVLVTDGLLDVLRPGSVVVDMGSSRPRSTVALAGQAEERGIGYVDAPVSGGVSGAAAGSLTVMVGGTEDHVGCVRPVLEVLGAKVLHVGAHGAGHALKALNNLMSAVHLLASSEALLAGREFGLDPAVMLDAVNGSSGRSGSTEVKWPRYVLPGTYDSGFGLRLMLKDMRIADGLARDMGWGSALAASAVDTWSRAADALPPDADHTELVRWLEKVHSGPETSDEPTG